LGFNSFSSPKRNFAKLSPGLSNSNSNLVKSRIDGKISIVDLKEFETRFFLILFEIKRKNVLIVSS